MVEDTLSENFKEALEDVRSTHLRNDSVLSYGIVPVMKYPFYIMVIIPMLATVGAGVAKDRTTQFWNLTRNTIAEFYLAPAGSTNWGPNQCKNDKDGAVDHDERLRIADVPSGTYDAKFSDVTGRICIVRGVKIEAGAIFSIEEKDLTSCDH